MEPFKKKKKILCLDIVTYLCCPPSCSFDSFLECPPHMCSAGGHTCLVAQSHCSDPSVNKQWSGSCYCIGQTIRNHTLEKALSYRHWSHQVDILGTNHKNTRGRHNKNVKAICRQRGIFFYFFLAFVWSNREM